MSKKNTRLNKCYHDMILRCYDNSRKAFKDYGARGIKVCDEWMNAERVPKQDNATKGWLAFKEWALFNGYSDSLTLDRIDTNGNYSPNNCRWVNKIIQANNTRRNHYILFNGQTKTLADWCRCLGLNYGNTEYRINRGGWSIEKAFSFKMKTEE